MGFENIKYRRLSNFSHRFSSQSIDPQTFQPGVINAEVVGQLVLHRPLNLANDSLRRTASLFNGHAVDSDFVGQDQTIMAGAFGLGNALV
jgi:hypothetical protein